ncbi:MAG: hypothetical protein ACREQD_16535, partial [Candidatus Binataceae bacterium]
IWMEGLRAMRPKGTKEITPGPALARIGQPIRFAPGTTVADATHTLQRTMERMRDEIHREQRAARPAAAPATMIDTQTARETAA